MPLTGKDLNEEISRLDLIAEKGSDERGLLAALVKVGTLMLKMLATIRGNQVAIMRKTGVELRKPRSRNVEKEQEDVK